MRCNARVDSCEARKVAEPGNRLHVQFVVFSDYVVLREFRCNNLLCWNWNNAQDLYVIISELDYIM